MSYRSFIVLVGLLFSASALAQRQPVPGEDFVAINPPQVTDSPGKIEVIEFFWYRCPHCYALEPTLEPWVKRLPKDTQFRRVPAVFNDDWAIDARIFYTLDALGEIPRLHEPLFNAIHQEGGNRLHGDEYAKWVAAWLEKHGVDMKKYDAAFNSFTVSSKLRRARQMTEAFKFDGVPALAVQGRYLVNASQNMLAVADYLIAETRRQLAGK
jgi:thiol:disulfide interchange protein DsbA